MYPYAMADELAKPKINESIPSGTVMFLTPQAQAEILFAVLHDEDLKEVMDRLVRDRQVAMITNVGRRNKDGAAH